MIDLNKLEERVILTAVCSGSEEVTAASLRELADLVSTAGARTVGALVQNRESVHPGTYLGKGKIEELRELLLQQAATGIVCDDELSPAQLNNLEEALETKVMDRRHQPVSTGRRHRNQGTGREEAGDRQADDPPQDRAAEGGSGGG